jgi:hypothetical protein
MFFVDVGFRVLSLFPTKTFRNSRHGNVWERFSTLEVQKGGSYSYGAGDLALFSLYRLAMNSGATALSTKKNKKASPLCCRLAFR